MNTDSSWTLSSTTTTTGERHIKLGKEKWARLTVSRCYYHVGITRVLSFLMVLS
jgi:hypothetical protein